MAREDFDNKTQNQTLQPPTKQKGIKQKGSENKILFSLAAFGTALLVIALIFGGLFYIVVHNNINGIGEKMRKNIQDVPVLNLALPQLKDPDDPKLLSENQLRNKYDELRKKRDELQKQLDEANKKISENQKIKENMDKLKNENDRLIKDAQEQKASIDKQKSQLDEEKKKIDELIATGNKEGFKEYFESVEKETAERIYSEIMTEQKISEDAKKFSQLYENMDPTACAKILEQLGIKKIDLIVDILRNMKKESYAEILAAMSPDFSAKVTEKLSTLYLKKTAVN